MEILKKRFFPHDHKPGHVKSLDGLRGIAVLIVLISHGSESGLNLIPPFNVFSYTGNIGVFLFFILSSYLLDRNISNALIRNENNREYWLNYIIRRFLRIYPLFIISLFIYYFLNLTYVENFVKNMEDIIDHLLLKKGTGFYWSISVEFIYYLVSPFILLVCSRFFKWNIKLISLFLLILILISVIIERHNGYTAFQTVNYLPIFLIGTFIAILEVTKKDDNKIRWGIVGLMSGLLIFITSMLNKYWLKDYLHNWNIRLFLPYGILTGFLLIAIRKGEGLFKKITEIKALRFIGVISFSLYLFHWAIMLVIMKYGTGIKFIDTTIYYFLSILISAMSYLAIEYPLSKININSFKIYAESF